MRVDWSSVNYKDGLAARRRQGRPGQPAHPGIDLAGEVIACRPVDRAGSAGPGQRLRPGRLAARGLQRVQRLPAGWVVPLPDGLTAREAMAIGTAGFTAAMSVEALEARGSGRATGRCS